MDLASDPATALLHCEQRGGLLWISASNGPVNALSQPLRQRLVEAIATFDYDTDLHAAILRCEGRTFFAGADLAELDSGLQAPGLLDFVRACEATDKPVVAALHGTVYGGGVVVAYACDWRVALPDTRFAMPEVALGLLPTFGGTQYLPRLLGVEAALRLVVDGETWSAAQALAAGLIDEIAAPGALLNDAERAARKLQGKRRTRDGARHLPIPEGAFDPRRVRVLHDHPGFEAPLRCLDVMQTGLHRPLEAALETEHAAFLQLLESAQSRRLRGLFFAERALRRGGFDRPAVVRRLRAAGSQPRPLQGEARRLLDEGWVPCAAVLDALIVETFALPRHAPSLIHGLLQEIA